MKKLIIFFITVTIALVITANPTTAAAQEKEQSLTQEFKHISDRLENKAKLATGNEKKVLLTLAAVYLVGQASDNLRRGFVKKAIKLYKKAFRLDPTNTVAKLALDNLQP